MVRGPTRVEQPAPTVGRDYIMTSDGALSGLRVIDLTTEMGVLAPRLFAGMGAEVIRIEPPGGDPLRRIGASAEIDGAVQGVWWAQQMRGRSSVEVALGTLGGNARFRELVASADFVIESRHAELDEFGLDYEDLAAENQHVVWVSITPFGRTGPRAHWKATDLIAMAAGGLLYLCGDRDRPPVRVTAEQGYAQAGVHAAEAAMLAHHARNRFGTGQLVDVSMQEAVSNALGNARLYYVVDGIINERVGGGRSFGSTGMRLIYPSADGHIAFWRDAGTYTLLAQWIADEGLVDTIDPKEWRMMPLVGPSAPGLEKMREFDAAILPLFAMHPTDHLYEEGQRRGLMICPVATVAGILGSPQLRARQFFVPTSPGSIAQVPGAPFKMSATPWVDGPPAPPPPGPLSPVRWRRGVEDGPVERGAPGPGEGDSRQVFAGLRVADFSWVGVGPKATELLAMMGADVIRVESSHKPDTFRSSGPWQPGTTGLDRSAYYANFNRDKGSVALNLRHPRAGEVARRLIAVSDVMTESFTPGFLAEVGLDWPHVRKTRPDIIMMSMSMEGQDGPHASFKGFGLTLQATAGITGLTGWPDRPPVGTGVAYTDWFATHIASFALSAALEHRRRTGEGQYIDLSQLEATVYALDAAILEFSATGRAAGRAGNRHARMAPHGVYPVAGTDRWIAIAVEDDEQWLKFCRVLRAVDWAGDERFATIAGRIAGAKGLDGLIAAGTLGWDGETLAAALQEAGIPAHIVSTTADLEADPQLAHREHGWRTPHPLLGPIPLDAPAFRLRGTPLYPLRPSPMLGEDNERVYREVLGYSEEEFIELMAAGVVE
jgi:crotonobetainyl-CoA:carnitine CoA-transferase CaiB-like acyl-CoA transferase